MLAACGAPSPTHELVFRVEQAETELDGVAEAVARRLAESGGTAEALAGDPPRVLCRVRAQDDEALAAIVARITDRGTFEFRICASDAESTAERRRRDELGFRWTPIDATRAWVPDGHERDDWLVIVPEAPLLAELSRLEGESRPEATERVRELREELERVRAAEVFGAADIAVARVMTEEDDESNLGMTVYFELRSERAEAFEEFTRTNQHRRVAMVLDGAVDAAPNIMSPLQGKGLIEGGGARGFKRHEAEHLVRVLTTTPLPARLTLVSTTRLGD